MECRLELRLRASDDSLVGDWSTDGIDTIGVRRGITFYLSNALRAGRADIHFVYGRDADTALAGDFDGDGMDTPAIDRTVR